MNLRSSSMDPLQFWLFSPQFQSKCVFESFIKELWRISSGYYIVPRFVFRQYYARQNITNTHISHFFPHLLLRQSIQRCRNIDLPRWLLGGTGPYSSIIIVTWLSCTLNSRLPVLGWLYGSCSSSVPVQWLNVRPALQARHEGRQNFSHRPQFIPFFVLPLSTSRDSLRQSPYIRTQQYQYPVKPTAG